MIEGCAVFLDKKNYVGSWKCKACYGGIPHELGGKCVAKYPENGQNWTNCAVGHFEGVKGIWGCMKCENGYFLDNIGTCRKISNESKGCLIAFGMICKLCDGANGYYQSQYLGPCVRD
jgi:hypothetical protein